MSSFPVREKPSVEHLARVKEVVDALDPAGLLAAGAPQDEYTPESWDLASLDPGELTLERVTSIMDYWFTPGGVPPATLEQLYTSLAALY